MTHSNMIQMICRVWAATPSRKVWSVYHQVSLPGMFIRNSDGIDFTAILKTDNNWYTWVTDKTVETKMASSTKRKGFTSPDSRLISVTSYKSCVKTEGIKLSGMNPEKNFSFFFYPCLAIMRMCHQFISGPNCSR